MNYREYLEIKGTGNMKLVEIEGETFLLTYSYEPSTGVRKEPEAEYIDTAKLDDEKASLQSKIDDIDTVLAEIDGLS